MSVRARDLSFQRRSNARLNLVKALTANPPPNESFGSRSALIQLVLSNVQIFLDLEVADAAQDSHEIDRAALSADIEAHLKDLTGSICGALNNAAECALEEFPDMEDC